MSQSFEQVDPQHEAPLASGPHHAPKATSAQQSAADKVVPHVPKRSLVDDLRAIKAHADGKPIAFGELFEIMRERGHPTVMLILTLPFLLPIPLIGLSIPVGLINILIGVCIIIGIKPWMPKWVLRRQMRYETVSKLVDRGSKMAARIDRLMRPSLQVMFWPGVYRLIGLSLVLASIALMLPIPFGNWLPAFAIIMLAMGLLGGDGRFILAGHVLVLGSGITLGFMWDEALEGMRRFLTWIF